ncbi:hypothetical protein V5N11_026125 [Cardamine amara subsp. amara]|uniref:Glutaredoxin domain-containing protein n=1 Tax=Cardamine amara subsp. amara TaxID=228776 RepID=A0ABD1B201_CARAN
MGACISTDETFSQLINTSTLSHHFLKLTSTTYSLLNLDSDSAPSPPPPSAAASVISTPATPMTPPERFTINGKESMIVNSEPEVINFRELMSSGVGGSDACRFSPSPVKCNVISGGVNKENSDPNWNKSPVNSNLLKNDDDEEVLKPLDPKLTEESEKLCDGGENRVVIYTTSLRGVRRTFEACNAVRAAIESFGVVICERDVSMDRGFREELSNLMAGEGNGESPAPATVVLPPRVFVKGKYIGGAEEVMSLVEEGLLGDLLKDIPRKKNRGGYGGGGGCDGCGGLAFLPCADCNGSCKVVEGWGSDVVVVKCLECNENGLVRCPICS